MLGSTEALGGASADLTRAVLHFTSSGPVG